jgi:hypothetical protein
MKREQSIQFFIATDKPKETTDVFLFRPFRKIRMGENKHIDEKAKTVGQLISEVNSECEEDLVVDVLPYDLKNADKIQDEDLGYYTLPILFDMHALRKQSNFNSLKNFIERRQYVMDAGPRTRFLDCCEIKNNIDENINIKLHSYLSRYDYARWPACLKIEELKIVMKLCMIFENKPKSKALIEVISKVTSDFQSLAEKAEIINNCPKKIMDSIDIGKFAKFDYETEKILEIDREKGLDEFDPKTRFGQWFLTAFSNKIVEHPEKHFISDAKGFGLFNLDELRLKDTSDYGTVVRSNLETQMKNILAKIGIIGEVTNEFKEDLESRNVEADIIQIRNQLNKHLVDINISADRLGMGEEFVNSMLLGALVVYSPGKWDLKTKEEKIQLNLFGINSPNDIQILSNTSETLSLLKPLQDSVEVTQVREVKGHLDLLDFPWKF